MGRLAAVLAVGWLCLWASPAWSDTVIRGKVTDIFGRPVVGAEMTVNSQGARLQAGTTDGQGVFSIEVQFGEFGTLDLIALHSNFVKQPVEVAISSFKPTLSSYSFVLLPTALASCIGGPGTIIVGEFLPPPGSSNGDLTSHVHRVLNFRILPHLQAEQLKTHLSAVRQDLLPEFLRCEGASPRSSSDGQPMAAALGGQGLVWGGVEKAGDEWDVTTSVTSALDIFDTPFTAISRAVDLGHPQEAVISPMVRVAVLVGIMANLDRAEECQAAIYVSNVVIRLLEAEESGGAPPGLQNLQERAAEIRGKCQSTIPHAGLLGEDTP